MKRLLILSGKGGTGKTTTAAAFIRFAQARAMADCDVDAPNLHLVSGMTAQPQQSEFLGGDKAVIDPARCTGCGLCARHCCFDAIRIRDGRCEVVDYACEGCGVCAALCPSQAVTLRPDQAGTLSLWDEEPVFSTATLKMGRGNSGKLVTQVKAALTRAAAPDVPLAIIDGSPGIGCPVIASVTGVDLVLIVAEPSLSGLSDLERILHTTSILQTPAAVCINKYDTNPEKAQAIQDFCKAQSVPFVGKIPYDKRASQAINAGHSLAQYDCPARDALYDVFTNTMALLSQSTAR